MSVAGGRQILGLNGARALAVTVVVWHHAHPGFAGLPISHNGFLGVDVFFVLSGFLITTLLLDERDSTGHVSLPNFYARRSLRIFPLYYAVLLFLAGYFAMSSASNQASAFFAELPFHATYTSNWIVAASLMAITWSLSTEEQFYLAWPPLLVALGRWAPALLLVFLAFNQVLNFGGFDAWLAARGLPYGALPILQITFTPIVFGVLLAYVLRSSWRDRLRAGSTEAAIAVGIVLLVVVANASDMRGWPRLAFHVLTALVLGAIVLRPESRFTRLLEWRPLAWLGTVSYGVYLLHKLALDAVQRGLGKLRVDSPLGTFALCLLLSALLAGLSFRFFERPLLRLRDRFRSAAR